MTTTPVLPKAALIVREAMLADPQATAVFAGRVFVGVIPDGAATPLVLITAPTTTPVTDPPTGWWASMVVIDIHTTSQATTAAAEQIVIDIATHLTGVFDGGVVQDAAIGSLVPITDSAWTPVRHRSVVTVDLTARGPN